MLDVLAATEPLARMVVQAAAASLVPGVLLAAAVAVGLRTSRVSAAASHAAWFAALLLVAAMPVASALRTATPVADRHNVVESQAHPTTVDRGSIGTAQTGVAWDGFLSAVRDARPTISVPAGRWVLLPFVVILAGMLVGLGRLLVALAAVARLGRTSRALSAEEERVVREMVTGADGAGEVPVRLTDGLRTPATAGFVRPAILLPPGVIRALTADDLRGVLLHELAHVRRGDVWWNLAQRLILAAVWWHPAARWISPRLELEREMACDEAVVRALGRPLAYARSLTRLAELARATRVPVLATAAAPRTGHLAHRVEALVAHVRRPRVPSSRKRLGATLVLTAGISAVAVAVSPAVALTDRSVSTVSKVLPTFATTTGSVVRHGLVAVADLPGSADEDSRPIRRVRVRKSGSGPGSVATRVVDAALPDRRPNASVVAVEVPAVVERMRPVERMTRVAAAGDEGRGSGTLDVPGRKQGRHIALGRGSFVAAYGSDGGPAALSGRTLADLAGSGVARFAPGASGLAYPRPRFRGVGGW